MTSSIQTTQVTMEEDIHGSSPQTLLELDNEVLPFMVGKRRFNTDEEYASHEAYAEENYELQYTKFRVYVLSKYPSLTIRIPKDDPDYKRIRHSGDTWRVTRHSTNFECYDFR
ncbi:MAG: hypothetical protein K2X81_18685 [Candidatus Obscuribacterales bacterium]|nr:hypothetical protein [Candidatus Obscuribacterales bacterium]